MSNVTMGRSGLIAHYVHLSVARDCIVLTL